MKEKFDIGKFVETGGEDIGRLKNDSPEAAEVTRMAAASEATLRKGREESKKTVESGENFYIGIRHDLTEGEINENADDIVKKQLGEKAVAKDLGAALGLRIGGSDNLSEAFMQRAVRGAKDVYKNYDEIQKQGDQAKIERLRKDIAEGKK